MSLNGITQPFFPLTIDGTIGLDASSISVDGVPLNIDNLVPYTGATKTINAGAQNIQTTHYAANDADVVNNKVLSDAVAFITTGVSNSYLNKITSDQQTVVSTEVDFSGIVTAASLSSNSSINIPKTTSTTHGWTITRQIGTGSYLKDLRFTDTETSTTALLLSDEGQTVYVGLTADYSTANTVPIFNASKKLVSSSVTSTTLGYLDATSSIQNQLNGKLSLTGGTLTGSLDMGSNKITSSYTPVNIYDLTNKTYVDSAISGSGSLYVLKAGDTMTGALNMGSNKITSSYTPVSINDLTNKTYVDTALALKANLTSNTFTGTNTFSSVTPINLSGLTASRVLITDASKNLSTSTVTTTTLGYLDATSSIQTQLNTLSGTFANYLPLTGGTLTGDLTLSGTGTSAGVLAKRFYLLGRSDNQDSVGDDNIYGPWYGLGESGITNFTGVPCLAGYSGCALRSSSGFMVLTQTGKVGVGTTNPLKLFEVYGQSQFDDTITSGLTTASKANLYLTTAAGHISGSAADAYLFTSSTGHIGIGSTTTIDASTTNLTLGVASTGESEIVSTKTDNSGYNPMTLASSKFILTGGSVGINTTNPACSLYNYSAATTGWAAQSYFGNGTTGVVLGTYNNKAYLGGQNKLLSAWTDLIVCPGSGNLGIGTDTAPSYKVDIFGGTRIQGQLYMNYGSIYVDGYGDNSPNTIITRNTSPSVNAYSLVGIQNNIGGCYWFINSSARAYDGGANTATIRNDAGALRLQSSGGGGITLDASTGYARQANGNNSLTLYGPNASYSGSLVVGASVNSIASTTAQVIATNGNIHIDCATGGYGMYLNYYSSGVGSYIQSYTPWTHNNTLNVTSTLTASSIARLSCQNVMSINNQGWSAGSYTAYTNNVTYTLTDGTRHLTGYVQYYPTTGTPQMTIVNFTFINQSTLTSYIYTQRLFSNLGIVQVVMPVDIVFSSSSVPSGNYKVYISNGTLTMASDSNDYCYLTLTQFPS